MLCWQFVAIKIGVALPPIGQMLVELVANRDPRHAPTFPQMHPQTTRFLHSPSARVSPHYLHPVAFLSFSISEYIDGWPT